jgi:hypothetical protein
VTAPPDDVPSLLRELVKWTKFEAKPKLKALILDNLKGDKELLVYELSDGEISLREMERATTVNKDGVSTLWESWFKLGILEKSPIREGRYKKICSLSELGIPIPPLPKTTGAASASENSKTSSGVTK